MKKNWKTKILVIGFIISLLFLIPIFTNSIVFFMCSNGFLKPGSESQWISFYGAVIGGALTLLGVSWTIYYQNQKEKSKNQVIAKPIFELEIIYESNRVYDLISANQIKTIEKRIGSNNINSARSFFIKITNTSLIPFSNFHITGSGLFDNENELDTHEFESPYSLKPGEYRIYRLIISYSSLPDEIFKRFNLRIDFSDIYYLNKNYIMRICLPLYSRSNSVFIHKIGEVTNSYYKIVEN